MYNHWKYQVFKFHTWEISNHITNSVHIYHRHQHNLNEVVNYNQQRAGERMNERGRERKEVISASYCFSGMESMHLPKWKMIFIRSFIPGIIGQKGINGFTRATESKTERGSQRESRGGFLCIYSYKGDVDIVVVIIIISCLAMKNLETENEDYEEKKNPAGLCAHIYLVSTHLLALSVDRQ